jgi:peroxiredoxin
LARRVLLLEGRLRKDFLSGQQEVFMEEKEVPTLPRLNEPAPDFTAKTTLGEIRLSDFKGKWVVLFSHPADFTPVCSTEFLAFARRKKEFEELGVQLGLPSKSPCT